MIWLNIHIQALDSQEFIGAEPVDRSTWLCLLRYCVGQENGGTIKDCAEWGDRKWQQLVRVTKVEAERVSQLWTWKGRSVVVWNYPKEKEAEVQRLRKQSKGASEMRWKKPKPPDRIHPNPLYPRHPGDFGDDGEDHT